MTAETKVTSPTVLISLFTPSPPPPYLLTTAVPPPAGVGAASAGVWTLWF